MRFGIPLLGERVAPRCTHGDGALLVIVHQGKIVEQIRLDLFVDTVDDLIDMVRDLNLDVLVCGGIDQASRSALEPHIATILPNQTGMVDEVLSQLLEYELSCSTSFGSLQPNNETSSSPIIPTHDLLADCFACETPVCLEDGGCIHHPDLSRVSGSVEKKMIEVARDLNYEDERRLCRLSELVYFCLEMGYHTLGVAYCKDLTHPAKVLTRVLRRFFTVHPVSCKLQLPQPDQQQEQEPWVESSKTCNPIAQATVLNQLGTDLNILVGLCIGADCLFSSASHAPVTTLFNKDRALANNPIGAIYSERYLREAVESAGEVRHREHPQHVAPIQVSPHPTRERIRP